jgi:membrane fusion protein (multidrug efflux system)
MAEIEQASGEGRTRRRAIAAGTAVAVVVALAFASRWLGLLGGGDAAAAAAAGAQGAAGEDGEDAGGGMGGGMPPMPVDVDTARRGTVVDAVRVTGRIEAIQSVELRPDEQGRVVELLFREGQAVEAGAPLVRVDDALLRAQAERAGADRDLARQQLERVRRLRAQNAAAPADLERAEAAARSAEAALAVLELQIARSTVRAPFAGVVGQRFVDIGDYVTTGTRLLTLQTMNPQHAVIEVPERFAGQVRPGQAVEFTIASRPDRTFRGVVEFIDPVVQPTTRTIVVKARAANPGHVLKPGMFIEARLAVATRAGAVVVPEDAVQPLRTVNVVWAVVDGRASRRIVELGVRSQGRVEILRGVEAGELVVVGGLERMGEGSPVAPRGMTPPAQMDSSGPGGPQGPGS